MSTPLAGQPDTACMSVGQGEGDNEDTAEILEMQLKEVNRNYCDIECMACTQTPTCTY